MVSLLAVSLLLAAPVPETNPDVLVLFAGDEAYRAVTAIEARYEGPLEFVPRPGGPGQFRLRIAEGDGEVRPCFLHLPRAIADLGPFAGQRVRILGKMTEQGLWPARIERLTVAGAVGRDGILARSLWQPPSARRLMRPVQTFVMRSGTQAAPLIPLGRTTAEEAATRWLERELRVPAIDWNRQMVVCVAIGLRTDVERLTITRTTPREGSLTVFYRLEKLPKGQSGGFGYPAETVLVPRFDGSIRFEEEGAR